MPGDIRPYRSLNDTGCHGSLLGRGVRTVYTTTYNITATARYYRYHRTGVLYLGSTVTVGCLLTYACILLLYDTHLPFYSFKTAHLSVASSVPYTVNIVPVNRRALDTDKPLPPHLKTSQARRYTTKLPPAHYKPTPG